MNKPITIKHIVILLATILIIFGLYRAYLAYDKYFGYTAGFNTAKEAYEDPFYPTHCFNTKNRNFSYSMGSIFDRWLYKYKSADYDDIYICKDVVLVKLK